MITRKDIAQKTTKELMADYIGLNDAIENTGCFSCRDLKLESWTSEELYKRGYEMNDCGKIVERDIDDD
jgi:hypothetical protein